MPQSVRIIFSIILISNIECYKQKKNGIHIRPFQLLNQDLNLGPPD